MVGLSWDPSPAGSAGPTCGKPSPLSLLGNPHLSPPKEVSGLEPFFPMEVEGDALTVTYSAQKTAVLSFLLCPLRGVGAPRLDPLASCVAWKSLFSDLLLGRAQQVLSAAFAGYREELMNI